MKKWHYSDCQRKRRQNLEGHSWGLVHRPVTVQHVMIYDVRHPSANAYEAVPFPCQFNAFLFLPRRPTRSSAFHSSQIPSCLTLLHHSAGSNYSRFCILFGPNSTIFLSIIRERTRFIESSRLLLSIDRESLIKVFLLYSL